MEHHNWCCFWKKSQNSVKKTWYIIQAFRHMLHYTISMRTSQNETNKLNYGNFFHVTFDFFMQQREKKVAKLDCVSSSPLSNFFSFVIAYVYGGFHSILLHSLQIRPLEYFSTAKNLRFTTSALNDIFAVSSYHSLFSCALHNFT